MTTKPAESPPLMSRMIFRSIHLVNFVIHRDTFIQLDQTPITLITGSNGSGKTLILDALMFAVGIDSKRSQRQRNAAFIGPFGKHAEVILELNNLQEDGQRLLQSPDPDMNRLLDNDVVSIRLRVLASNNLSFWINGKRKVGNRRITRQDIRGIFQAAGVFSGAPLAITEAETLDQFASQTPRRKFETLLNETGLKDWMEKLEEARLLVMQAKANVSPLRHRIRQEEQRLQVLKEAFEAYQQKQKLQARLSELAVEAVWAEVAYREQLVNQLETTTSELEHNLEKERAKMDKLDQQRGELDTKRHDVIEQRTTLLDTLQTLRDKQMQVRGQRTALDDELRRINTQIARYTKSNPIAAESVPVKEEVVREELAGFLTERDQLDDRLAEISRRIATHEEELITEPQRFPRREEEVLRACQRFRQQLNERELSRPVLGPIFSLVQMKREHEQLETAVKLAFGRYTYAFLALNRESFSEAKQLFDHLWPYEKPNLLVARLDTAEVESRSRPQVSPPIYGWAADLIEGDHYAVTFLTRVVNTAIAEAEADPNLLTDAAQQLGGNIITSDGASHYLRIGAFTRPPPPVTVPLGTSLDEVRLGRDTSDMRRSLRELRQEEATVMRDRVRMNSEISQLRSQLHNLHQERTAELAEADRSLIVTDLEQRVLDIQRQITDLEDQLDVYGQESQKCSTKLSPLTSRLQTLDEQLRRVDSRRSRREAELEQLRRELRAREDELELLLNQLKVQRQAAEEQGTRPLKVRRPEQVRDEQLQVQAMVETIRATVADQEAYEEQEKLVRRLNDYIEQRRRHIENLMTDVQRRLTEWRRFLEETVEALNRRMNQLLSHYLKQVRFTVRYPDEPSRAELHIQFAINRKGAWHTYENMSGGERVLGTQTFILALHTLAKSPLHVIDEFTQRLDEASRAAVLSIVQRSVELSRENLLVDPQFLLMAPSTVGLDIPPTIHHVVLVKSQVER